METTLTTTTDKQIKLADKKILCNDIKFPWEYNPHKIRLFVIGNEYGPLGALWASNEQEALDELVDQGLGNALLIDEKDATEETPRLGNASEPACLDYVWIAEVRLDEKEDLKLLVTFAKARGSLADTLEY